MQKYCILFSCAAVGAAAMMVNGCNALSNPWRYGEPPAAYATPTVAAPIDARRPIVAVGRFDDPTRAPAYANGSGACVGRALARALLASDGYNVLVRPEAVESPSGSAVRAQRASTAGTGASANGETIHYIITGKVTDFFHSSDLPEDVSRWGLVGRRREAIVAIELRVIDVSRNRVLLVDQFKATAPTGGGSGSEVYEELTLDSYLFWSTPLGRATRRAVERAADRIEQVLPQRLDPPQIARRESQRHVVIDGGSRDGLRAGRDYYLVRRDGSSDGWILVHDPATDLPLRIRILRADRDHAEGWLQGQPPDSTPLRGLVLMKHRPRAESDDATTSGTAQATGQ